MSQQSFAKDQPTVYGVEVAIQTQVITRPGSQKSICTPSVYPSDYQGISRLSVYQQQSDEANKITSGHAEAEGEDLL